MFGNQSSTVDELKEFIVQHLKAFDPADPYWKVVTYMIDWALIFQYQVTYSLFYHSAVTLSVSRKPAVHPWQSVLACVGGWFAGFVVWMGRVTLLGLGSYDGSHTVSLLAGLKCVHEGPNFPFFCTVV